MELKISLKCGTTSGVMARAVVAVRRAGYELVEQHGTETSEGNLVELVVKGNLQQAEELSSLFKQLNGVVDVEIQDESDDSHDLKAQQGAARDIANAYPNIEELVADQLDLHDKKEAPDAMFELGLSVATQRHKTRKSSQFPGDIAGLVNNDLLPDIEPIAKAEYDSDGLKVHSSIFTKPTKPRKKKSGGFLSALTGANIERCDFLRGYIQGVMDKEGAPGATQVSEVYCRQEGQPYCLFQIDPNQDP